jgi:N-formylglutamate deformylase
VQDFLATAANAAMMRIMMQAQAYQLSEPSGTPCQAVCSSPHSGRFYPREFVRHSRLGALELRASEDAFVDRLFGTAPIYGAPLISAVVPRAYVDLNRGAEELDPSVVEGVRATGLNPRIAAGLGVIPRVVAEGAVIYARKISRRNATDRLARYHTPYHDALAGLMRRARTLHGSALLFDCHSMPRDALRSVPRVRGRRPEIVLGDRFGSSAAHWIVAEVQGAFEAEGFTVVRNVPFAGGYITQRYGRPGQGWHGIQIEIDRGLYLDERRIEPLGCFNAVQSAISRVIARLCRTGDNTATLAAE